MKIAKILILVALSSMLVNSLAFGTRNTSVLSEEAITERIKSEGQVNISKTVIDDDAPAENADSKGAKIFNDKCSVCHDAGVAGAPKKGDNADWKVRQTKGIKALLQSAIHGLGAMPPKGTCIECTDAELQEAIEYMLPKK